MMIDQCEELLTIGANEEGNRFLAFLRALLDCEASQLMVLATLRSDFLGSFQDHPAMRGLRVETFPVPQMEVDEFTPVIEGPARIADLELGSGLVQAMINDTKTADALPLLAFTLRELYEGFGEDKLLTLEEYRDKLGRIEGCIARAAEAVLTAKQLSEKELSDLRTAFLSMVRVTDKDQYAKQPAQWNDLPASSHDALARFVSARLLISSGDERGRTLEIAHEALFRAWPRLADWLKDNKSFLVWQQRLNGAIKHYEESKQNPDLFLRGFPLTEAVEWLKRKPECFSHSERQFVTASQNRKVRTRIAVAFVASLVVLLIGGTTWLLQKRYSVDQAMLKVKSLFVSIHLPPDMQPVSAGTFLRGDTHGLGERLEQPVHEITIKSFFMGKFEVTFDEYDRFAVTTGRTLPSDMGWGGRSRPVINVSWEDTQAYAQWLSEATGKRYRLPTESEWEYAARSGGKDEIWAGTSDERQLKDYAVYRDRNRTEEVGSKKPNGLGLYDMSGNVWEWVEDCVHDDYTGAPKDGSAWLEANDGNCDRRVVRGGSWSYASPWDLRASRRGRGNRDLSNTDAGFRLAQDIEP
jgi:formylglycine-generating enzyme required for sulfatase activity